MTRSERTLWRRWVERRDGEAFAALVRRHARFVYDFARRVAGNAADAEDLTQEAYLKLAEAEPGEPDAVGLRAFLGRRVVLGARMLKRAALSRRRHESQVPHPGGAGGPEEIERREQAQKALGLLPAGERRAVELRFLHDLSYAEIAGVLGTAEEAARMRVHRGLERMKSRLGRDASACVAALALFEPPARMLASTAKTALLTGGVVVAQATGKKAAILLGLALLLGLSGTFAVHLASEDQARGMPARAPTVARTEPTPAATPVAPSRSSEAPPPAPARITGIVVNAAGTPIPDATVRALRYDGYYLWIELSVDEGGRFDVDLTLPQRRCTVEVRHPSYATATTEATVGAEARIVLEPGVAVRVEVRGDGSPIAGARVAAPDGDAMLLAEPGYRGIGEGVTNEQGIAEFRLPAGKYAVWASARGWAPKLAPPVICTLGNPQSVLVELERGGVVEGAVRDSRGGAVSGARVVVRASPGFRGATTTDEDGRFLVEHVPLVQGPSLLVVADHRDHAATSAWRQWAPGDGDRMRFDLAFRETSRLHGIASDASGLPLGNRRVVVGYQEGFHILYGYPWMSDRWPFGGTTDDDGRFELAGLPPGKATVYLLPDFRDSVEIELTPGETHGPVELRTGVIALRGRVLDAEGRPVESAEIGPGQVRTDKDGRFALRERPKEITIIADGYVPVGHQVGDGEAEVRLSAVALTGIVIDPDGRGLPDITVTLLTEVQSRVCMARARTNRDGRFRFCGASKGLYQLDVRQPGRDLVGGRRSVWGPEPDLVLVLATPDEAERRCVRGTVVDGTNRPIDEPVAYRRVAPNAPERWAARRAGQPGSFVCEQLDPLGAMRIVFGAAGYLNSDPVEVHFDGRTPVEPLTVRLVRGAEVEVVVREEDGTPVRNAYVSGYSANAVSARTGPDGSCVLTGLPPGRSRITASHSYLTDMNEAYVEATAGARQRVELRGKAAGQIVVRIPVDRAELPENLHELKEKPRAKMPRAQTSLLLQLLDARGAVVREDRIEKWRLVLTERESQRQFGLAVTAPGTYRIRCELDGVPLPEVEVEVRLRETAVVDLKPAR